MKLSELFDFAGSSFPFYPEIAKRFQLTSNATLFLCFICWKTYKESDGWRELNVAEITDNTGLSPSEQKTARSALKKAGLLEDRYVRINHKISFRLTTKELLPSEHERNPSMPLNGEHERKQPMPDGEHERNPSMGIGENSVSTVQEKKSREVTREEKPAGAGSPQKEFIAAWEEAFQDLKGESYSFQGAKDGAAAARFASKLPIPLPEVIATAKAAWAHLDKLGWLADSASSIAGFVSRWNEIRAKVIQLGAVNGHGKGRERPADDWTPAALQRMMDRQRGVKVEQNGGAR